MLLKWIRKTGRYAAMALAAFLVVRLFFGNAGLMQQVQVSRTNRALEARIDSLRDGIEGRRREIQMLKTDSFHLESLARVKLGMQRPGERTFQFVESGDTSPVNPAEVKSP